MTTIDDCEPLLEFIRKYVELDSSTSQLIASNATEVILPRKQIILHEEDISDKVYFLVTGLARSYYTDSTGKTITWSFHFNSEASISRNLFMLDYRAFLSKKRSSVAIEMLTDVKALSITKQQVDFLIESSPVYERWTRKLNESAFMHMYDRAFTLLTMTAAERYEKLLSDEPHLLKMFSSYYVASYLGIAPQSLSRIRSHH